MPNKPWKQAAYMHSSGMSVRQWAIKNNVCYFNIREHILAGMEPDSACEYARVRKGKHDTKNKWYINGVNLAEYCRQNNLRYNMIIRRLKKMPIDEAVSKSIKPRRGYDRF